MATAKTWKINTMQRDTSDGHVNFIIYSVLGADGLEEKGQKFTGEVRFVRPSSLPSDFVAYDSLDEATVVGWVKTSIGSDRVSEIEKQVENSQVYGKPFN